MGKAYFEFLEEAFQSLTSEVQKSLALLDSEESTASTIKNVDGTLKATKFTIGDLDDDNDFDRDGGSSVMFPKSNATIPQLFTRCRAIFQKMYFEAKTDADFQERLGLYRLQLQTLVSHYESKLEEQKKEQMHEVTFSFVPPEEG